MNIQEMLGDAFHEGMSIDEINTALSGKKFADLSTGNYVDANKYKAEVDALNKTLAKKTSELNARLSDDEKAAASREADKAYIKQLEEQVKSQAVSSNRDRAEALTTDLKTILGIEANDEGYNSLLGFISNGDADTTRSTASYINKIVKDSYEKGKKDATKDSLGSFSDGVNKQGSGDVKNVGDFGKQLAQANSSKTVDSNFYFQKN